jgi:signal transduction histidine kinase
MDCDVSGGAERLSTECELVLFRVLEESLTNVRGHGERAAFG